MRRTSSLYILPIILFAGLFATFLNKAEAASLTWDGGGADNNWNTCANWTTDTCPASGDNVTFNGTSGKNATINVNTTVNSINVTSAYTGIITQSADFTTNLEFRVGGGTYTWSSGALVATRDFYHTGGMLTLTGATTTFSGGTNNSTMDCVGTLGGVVNIAKTSGMQFELESGCSISLASSVSTAGNITISGTMTVGSSLALTGTRTLSAQSGGVINFDSGDTLSTAFVSNAGTLTLPSNPTITSTLTTSSGGST
jgi:hypothetical protein